MKREFSLVARSPDRHRAADLAAADVAAPEKAGAPATCDAFLCGDVTHASAGQVVGLGKALALLRESDARFHRFTAMSADWYWEQDADQRITFLTKMESGLGTAPREIFLGKTRREAPGLHWDEQALAALEALFATGQPFRDFRISRTCQGGPTQFLSLVAEPILDASGQLNGYCGIGQDVTERILAEERVAYLLRYDSLTGLANRDFFCDRLGASLKEAERDGRMVGILYIDLDGFKYINDSNGHDAGDLLLKLVAQRLLSCVRREDTVGRQGGDEFAIAIAGMTSVVDADLIAERVVELLAQPFSLDGRETLITASIGISIYPLDGTDAAMLLKYADTAMYQGKELGRNNFQSYSLEIDDAAAARRQLAHELRHAIAHQEFELHYQPQVSLSTGRIIGAEAMLRWRHPTHGMLVAAEFIDVAEETGLILPIAEWVFEAACMQVAEWHRAGYPDLLVAVNVSLVEIRRGKVVAQARRALACSGIAPRHLEIELTESVAIDDAETFARTLGELKGMGLSLAIDDFGTGYSSLGSLKSFPIDKVKINQSFMRDIADEPDDGAIVQAVIAMSHHLRLEVVSKGVETERQAGFLRRCRCDIAQGFLFGAPMQADCFRELLDDSDEDKVRARALAGAGASSRRL